MKNIRTSRSRSWRSDSSKVVSQIVDHIVDVGFTGTVLEKKHCRYLPFYKDKLAVITPNTERYRRLKEESPDGIDWILEGTSYHA